MKGRVKPKYRKIKKQTGGGGRVVNIGELKAFALDALPIVPIVPVETPELEEPTAVGGSIPAEPTAEEAVAHAKAPESEFVGECIRAGSPLRRGVTLAAAMRQFVPRAVLPKNFDAGYLDAGEPEHFPLDRAE